MKIAKLEEQIKQLKEENMGRVSSRNFKIY